MNRSTGSAVAGLLLLAAASPSQAQSPLDRRCTSGDDVRRIEIRFADDQDSLPCRVIYRPEAESDTVGIVSWRGIRDLGTCEAQAREIVDRLTDEGWTCTSEDPEDATSPENLSEAALREPDGTGDEPSGTTEPEPLATIEGPPPSEDLDPPARLVDNPDLPDPPTDLAAMIEQDLARLDTTLDGALEAQLAGHGDVNDDDLDDALVIYTYISPQPAHRQFLAVYLFDGETYRLSATRSVGGNVNGTTGARVEAVDRGVIHLSLQAFEPGDDACCPSGRRVLALALRDLDLVEINSEAPTR